MSGGGGGSKSTTTVQKADPWKNVQDDLTSVYNALAYQYGTPSFDRKGQMQGFTLGQGPQYYPGSTVATPSGVEQWGQQQQFDQLGNAYNVAGQGMNALGALAGAPGDTGYGNGYARWAMNEMQGAGKNMQDTGFRQANTVYDQLLGHGGWMQGVGAGNFIQGAGGVADAAGQLMAAGDPSNNPFFQQAVQSAIRPVTQQFQEQVLPGIKSGAIGAGQMGSSRQGVAEGIASRGYLDTVGDITSGMGNQAYAQGLQAMQAAGGLGGQLAGLGSQFAGQGLGALGQAGQMGQGLLGTGVGAIGNAGALGSTIYGQGLDSAARGAALAPSVQQSLFTPGTMTERIGQQQTADAQAQIDADLARWNYEQNLPYSQMADYLGLLQGAAGGTTASSMSGGNTGSLLGRVGGGALAGYGMTSNPWGALAGGLLGLF